MLASLSVFTENPKVEEERLGLTLKLSGFIVALTKNSSAFSLLLAMVKSIARKARMLRNWQWTMSPRTSIQPLSFLTPTVLLSTLEVRMVDNGLFLLPHPYQPQPLILLLLLLRLYLFQNPLSSFPKPTSLKQMALQMTV